MKYILLLLMSVVGYDAHAVKWPSISDPFIRSCEDQNQNTSCDKMVYYRHGGTVMLEQPELIKPPNKQDVEIFPYGIHCGRGSNLPGYESPFADCYWDEQIRYGTHAPRLNSPCLRVTYTSWELRGSSTCATDLNWGGHSGAGPGGECVLFGVMVGSLLYTPMGAMDATTAANAGNRFCVKPLPPAIKCELKLNDTILDHGVLPPNGSSTASVTGVIECGQKPIVEFVGGDDFMIAPGINGKLNADVDTVNKIIKLNSLVTTVNAKGGSYSASKVVTVTPW